jgi:hypothetical protein
MMVAARKLSYVHLPTKPGHYLWYILDLGYLRIGSVTVREERGEHRDKLFTAMAVHGMKKDPFFLYPDSSLVMYHDAHDSHPPKREDGCPIVDDFVAYDLNALLSEDKRCDRVPVAVANRAGGSTTAKASNSPVSAKRAGRLRSQSTARRFFGRTLRQTWTSRSKLIRAIIGGLLTWFLITTFILFAHYRR